MATRRSMIIGAAAVAGSAGCVNKPCDPPAPPSAAAENPLIDGHCHTFNVTDLSAVRFLSYVLAKHYPEVAETRLKTQLYAPEDPDAIDALMQAALDVLGAGSAPTAVEERQLLQGVLGFGRGAVGGPRPLDPEEDRQAMLARAAQLLDGKRFNTLNALGEARLRAAILRAAGNKGVKIEGVAPASAKPSSRTLAEAAFSDSGGRDKGVAMEGAFGDIYLPGVFNFIAQLKRFRHCEVDTLAGLHRKAGQEPRLIAPAMVDFGRWLRDDPAAGSSFVEQAKLWPLISRRPGGPAVHGYVAFCPLRQVEFDKKRFGAGEKQIHTACDADPLAVVRTALETQGFIGVKLYPPMGFRACQNAKLDWALYPYPKKVLQDVFGEEPPPGAETAARSRELGEALDGALDRLFDLCCELDAPIMAHGGNSVGANRRTGDLADPYFWGQAMLDRAKRNRPTPRVMLAHFGGFDYRSADPASPSVGPDGKLPWEATWEASTVRFIDAHPEHRLYADLSYFTEALGSGAPDIGHDFGRLSAHPLMRDRLVFGTDWVMLAKERGVPGYGRSVRAFLTQAFDRDIAAQIMRRNFLTYSGLAQPPGGGDSPAFQRISRIYGGDPRLLDRLRLACSG